MTSQKIYNRHNTHITMKITIFGLAGTGTSTIGKLLAKKLNYKFKSSGNMIREIAKQRNQTIYEFEKEIISDSNFKFDIQLDNKIEEFGRNNKEFILESRLAWHFIPDSFKIKLTCDKEESYKRITKRENIPINKAKKKTIQRANGIIERYSKVYPHIQFPPQDEKFNIIIDTTKISPEEIVSKIMQKINQTNQF